MLNKLDGRQGCVSSALLALLIVALLALAIWG
jgi:hypothetical protein